MKYVDRNCRKFYHEHESSSSLAQQHRGGSSLTTAFASSECQVASFTQDVALSALLLRITELVKGWGERGGPPEPTGAIFTPDAPLQDSPRPPTSVNTI
ncbi:hypothetical protein CDAR_559131 [Caerostris darwini]|uniref:Uncharacterized protein n=1 Tax=Caerostris darwini TaxID=1538125 RepID=A0AAV4P2M8_9ARAC|nr:hypothetical protein CDAR_559131 [Caerostris darwini]